jgi:hypothetical protein
VEEGPEFLVVFELVYDLGRGGELARGPVAPAAIAGGRRPIKTHGNISQVTLCLYQGGRRTHSGKRAWNIAMQSGTRTAGAIVVTVGLLLFVCAFLWMKYSDGFQARGRALIHRISGAPIIENNWYFGPVRWFGTVFLGVMSLPCVIFGLMGLMTGR